MPSPQDDLIGQQLPTTFDQIDNSDPAWTAGCSATTRGGCTWRKIGGT
jgi:hypothetical protein